MDFKSLLQSMDTLSEGDVVHKGTYGTSHGSEDVRDQYGHKIGKVNKDAAATKPAEKRGRGRPKKGADASGEVKKYDFTAFGGGKKVNLPKWDKSKTTKHSLKEYIEEVEEIKTTQTIVEGLDSDKRARLDQLIDMFRDSTEPDDYYHREYENPEEVIDMIRQEFGDNIADTVASGADKMHSPRQGHSMDIDPMQLKGSPRVTKLGKINRQDVDAMKRSIKGRLGVDEAEQVTIAPAQQNTQVIKQGNKTLGTVTNPQLAQQIKQSIGKGEMTLMPGQKEMAEDAVEESGLQAYLGNKKYGTDGMEALRKAGQEHASEKEMQNIRAKYSSKEEVAEEGDKKWIKGAIKHPGAFTKKAKAHGMSTSAFAKKVLANKDDYPAKTEKQASLAKTLSKMHESPQIDESISLSESPDTLQHIISKYKNEVKRFMAGEELDNDLYDALFDYYFSAGEMPYGVAKARTGDPFEWISQRFDQDLPEYVEEGHYTTHGMNSGPKSMEPSRIQTPNKPVPNPTPFSVDPINATTDRAINFIAGLRKPKQNPFEGKEMKDVQLESWESQLNSLLTEGITVSSSTGQQGAPDTVTVSASDADADQLLQVLRQAGVGVFGGGEKPMSQYGAPMAAPGEEPAGHGTDPEQSPEVVGDEDDMLALIKKMTGIQGDEQGSQDYKDEEGSDEPAGTLEPTDDEEGSDEEVDEGNKYAYNVLKAKEAGKKEADLDGDGDMERVKEDDMEEGNMFTGNLAKARAQGKEEADLDGDGDMEKVHEGHDENCNECGYTMEACDCDHEKVEESEYANSDDDQHMQDLYYMINTITGGLNGKKRDQTVLNPTQVKVTESDSITDWKKLSGIK